MHHYQPIPDIESGDVPPVSTATTTVLLPSDEKDIESQLPPKYEQHSQQSEVEHPPTLLPSSSSSLSTTRPAMSKHSVLRKPWVILSLPLAITVLISTSVIMCRSSLSSQTLAMYVSPIYPSIIEQQVDTPCVNDVGEGKNSDNNNLSPFNNGLLSSSSWPGIPLSPIIAIEHDPAISDITLPLPTVMDKTTGMNEIIESSGIEDDDNKQLLGGINIISIDPTNQAAAAVEMMVAIENEVELLEDLKEDWTYDDDDEIDNEWMDDDDDNEEEDEKDREVDQSNTLTTAMLGQVAVIETLIGQVTPEMFDNILDEVNIEISEDNVGINDEGSVVTLSLRKNGDDDDDDDDDDEKEEDDEDEQDHFPTNIGKDDNEDGEEDDEDQQGKKTDTKEEKHVNPPNNIPSNSIDGKTNQGNGNVTKDIDNHKHGHQDQNANLGGTGGNGPILLCSSKSCLPSLRDSILSKIAVQIHQVMDHLRSRNILVHRMSLTAPQTKESLMAGQEELVQQLEDRINNDLREWVNGFRHKFKLTDGGTGKVATTDASSMVINTQTISDDAEVSAETESLFPIEDEFEEETQGDRPDDSFYMTSLSLEDADDDDEDHEDDPFIRKHTFHPVTGSTATTTTKNKARPKKSTKKAAKSKVHKRDMSSSSIGNDATKSHEYFLSADKLLMRQEWSRWIAHWVHHTKLLILSHTLEPQTLTEMNQIAIAGENVVSADQRHWSWNLDKALATVMVASEMICGGPTSAKDVKVFISTLSTSSDSIEATSVNIGDKFPDIMSPKALAITLNAQKCIEAWSQDLEDILQRTATTA